ELVELGATLGRLDVTTVDGVQPHQRIELLALVALLAFPRDPHGSGDRVTATQAVLADHVHGHVHVVGSGEVAGGPHERVVVENVEDACDGLQDIVLADLGFASVGAAGLTAIASTTAFAESAAPATAAAFVVVAVVLAAVVLARPLATVAL